MEEKLRERFVKTYATQIQTIKDIEILSTKIGVSKNTLRRFLGKMEREGEMRISTLNLISKFMGYKSFDDFCNADDFLLSDNIRILDIFYNSVKGKGIKVNEDRFHDVNYQYAKYIISNPKILKSFIEKFADNFEALEYVLAWHPTYGKITDRDYQSILINMGELTKVSHLRVFARSFALFGRFVSLDFHHREEIEKEIQCIDKYIVPMREQYGYFDFPEFRASIAKILYFFHYLDNERMMREIRYQYQIIKNRTCTSGKVWSAYYLADCFNLIGLYQEAHRFHSLISEQEWEDFKAEYHYQRDWYLFEISKAITLFHIGERAKSQIIFEDFYKNVNFADIPFDIKDYIELQFYLLGKKLYPRRTIYSKQLKEKIKDTHYIYFEKL